MLDKLDLATNVVNVKPDRTLYFPVDIKNKSFTYEIDAGNGDAVYITIISPWVDGAKEALTCEKKFVQFDGETLELKHEKRLKQFKIECAGKSIMLGAVDAWVHLNGKERKI